MNNLIIPLIIIGMILMSLFCLVIVMIEDEGMLICQKTHSYAVCHHTIHGS